MDEFIDREIDGFYRKQYAKKYGIEALGSAWDIGLNTELTERIYKESLEKGITWKELLDFKDPPAGVFE